MARSLSLVFVVAAACLLLVAVSEAFPNFGCGIVRYLEPEHHRYPYDRYSGYKHYDYEYPGYGSYGYPYYQHKHFYGGW